jgi:signal peptidase I
MSDRPHDDQAPQTREPDASRSGEPHAPHQPHRRQPISIKETLISIMIAFVMAFVFRAFVIEAFRIPTGSMAPTLMGAHTRFRGPMTGATWQVGPWEGRQGAPSSTQNVTVHDPNLVPYPGVSELNRRRKSASELQASKPLLAGDRILVFKYLPPLLSPERFDICVFKYPGGPQEAYIKRLIGLPGEQVALVDGDVFVRKIAGRKGADGAETWAPSEEELNQPGGTWDLTGWEIARKPERVQREVWQPVYDADLAPATPLDPAGARWFSPPWTPQTAGWDGLDGRSYAYSGDGPTMLAWDTKAWPIVDWYPYNETGDFWQARSPGGRAQPPVYPVGDIRIRMGYSPQGEDVALTMGLATRRTQFLATLEGRGVSIQMRPQPTGDGPEPAWDVLESVELRAPLATGRITEVEFWHVDQALSVYIDGKRIAHRPYYWNPSQRIGHATALSAEQILARENPGFGPISDTNRYTRTAPEIQLSGPATLHRVAIDRDIYYQPGLSGDRSSPLRGAHPRQKLVILNSDQFFTCGDNSPSSSDGRMWESVDRWVARIDDTPGIVPRSLMVGRAFLVYFPALHREGGPLVAPDFGRLRFLY